MLCVCSLSDASGSRAGDGTEGKVGAFLHFTVFQTAAVSSAMFLTANHPNPLSAKFAEAATGQVRSWFSLDLMSCDDAIHVILLIRDPTVGHKLYV